MKHNKRGFTLVEVIAVLVIIVMATVIAVPNIIGYVTKHKEKNCTLALESLLSKIQTTCAVERYNSSVGVSADIISAVSTFDDSVKDTPATSFGLKLNNFCNDENTVYLSWEISEVKDDELQTGFDVEVTAKCQDGNVGKNHFVCGYKNSPADTERMSLANMIQNDILNAEIIKTAYTNGVDNIIEKISSITNIINPDKFNAVKDCINSLGVSDAYTKKNLALSMCLTVVINEKEICKNKFYKTYNDAGYMPIVAYTGGLDDNIYGADGSNTVEMGKGGFMILGLGSARLDSYFSVDKINANFKNDSDIAFMANCVWNEDYSKAYFLNAGDAKPVSDIVNIYDNILSGVSTDWVSE